MKILSMPSGAPAVFDPVFLTAGGSSSFSINIPAQATYIITFNTQNNGVTPTITNCTYIGTVAQSHYDWSNYPVADRPAADRNIRVFQVNSTGAATVAQSGATYIGYLTSSGY